MSKRKALEQKELGHISIAELIAYATEQHLEEDVRGNFNKIERSSRALIEGTATLLTPKHGVPQVGLTL